MTVKKSALHVRFAVCVSTILLSAPVMSATLTHSANVSKCTLFNKVHGKCVSTARYGMLDVPIVELDVRCYLQKDGRTISSRSQDIEIDTNQSVETTRLHTSLVYNKHYCAKNKSRYRQFSIAGWLLGHPVVVGQSDGVDCEWIQGSGVLK
ncbi:MAG: hypothetical protein AAFX10_08055 [Pseudomonadota bacterium]